VEEIVLNVLHLAIWTCQVRKEEVFHECPFAVDPKNEVLRITLPQEMSGKIGLRIEYTGEINDRMAGFYRSKYQAGEEEKYIAVTQFEESDARRAFPCLDHPASKATFDVEMMIDQGLTAISNGRIVEERLLDDGRKAVTFERTPKMSTYLLFFGVGDFEFIEEPGEVLVRVATMPAMTKYAQPGLEFGRKSLEFSGAYYGIKYPLSKLDLIAVPDFAFGAMENWGAITFRENLLLHYPGITSKAGEERIYEVIAHEIAHQWFGNLVTPADWKFLWLNESFATYFGYGVVDHYYPDWDVWPQFLNGQTGSALDRDALQETFPIEIPGGEHVVINASTAPIIYSKGASIMRQVQGYIGEDCFQEGLRKYLRQHEYGCASSHHLWEAFEAASSKPVTKMMRSWIEQPGFPVVEARREGGQLLLQQKRFTYLPGEDDQEWLIPLSIRLFFPDGRVETISDLMEGKSKAIEIDDNAVAYKLNYDQTGFYRVRYLEEADLNGLGERIAERGLESLDRWGLENDLYALVRRGDVSPAEYLRFLSFYAAEDAYLPLTSIAGHLHHLSLVSKEATKDQIASIGRALLERVLSGIGLEPESDEKHTTSMLREQLIGQSVLYGSSEVAEFASEKFASLTKGDTVHPDILKSVMQVGAMKGGPNAFKWLTTRIEGTDSEHERMNILVALGGFQDRALIEATQKYVLDKVPDRNKFIPIGALAVNPDAIPLMWEWFVSNLDRLETFHPVHYERVIGAIVPLGGLEKQEEIKAFFEEYMQKKELARDVIRLSLERLAVNERIRAST
jgi:tricorn protease interacting factor F2/3